MSATYNEAKDEIFALFKTAWDTVGWNVIYQNIGSQQVPEGQSDPWARVQIIHATGGNDAIGDSLMIREGTFWAQIFVPLGEGLKEGYDLAKVVSDAFDGKRSLNVWFRNGRINEVGPDGEWFQINYLVDFEYNEVK